MKEEFEMFSYSHTYYNMFITNLLYRVPHMHREYELCLLISGEVTINSGKQALHMNEGDIWLISPYQSHELTSKSSAQILCLQIPPSFFTQYFSRIHQLHFHFCRLGSEDKNYNTLLTQLVWLGQNTFAQEEFYELRCASLINYIFFLLTETFNWYLTSPRNQSHHFAKTERFSQIENYIEEHYSQKLFLSDISKYLGLSRSYLSHFFKDNFGMSFQDYLANFRCEKARILLLSSSLSLLDISLSCGFSDPKYLNKHFLTQFGCTPKQYRNIFLAAPLSMQQKVSLTTQNILSMRTSLMILNRYAENNGLTWY